ncbi:hypothetical protein CNY89_18605, partial [Amaricoccus sp. HAR-UPW-R2A-40]
VAAWVLWRLDGGIDHILVDEAQDTSPAQWSVIARRPGARSTSTTSSTAPAPCCRASEVAAWVLWRLDGGIDHILVDEAQDTSPAQWSVIAAITDEFFAGRGARDLTRTVFVVGDEKQSIYSFQGADPAAFGSMQRRFGRILEEMGDALARCDLLWSFRSARPILSLVDAVFTGKAGEGFAAPPRHLPIAPDAPGRVEVWPFLEKPEKEEESPWDLPEQAAPFEDPAERLADRIAGEIRTWLD